jgi:hypothetical protein
MPYSDARRRCVKGCLYDPARMFLHFVRFGHWLVPLLAEHHSVVQPILLAGRCRVISQPCPSRSPREGPRGEIVGGFGAAACKSRRKSC